MELPGRLVDTAQVSEQDNGILGSIIALTLQDCRVIIDRIAGIQGDLFSHGDGFARRWRSGRWGAVHSAHQLRLALKQRELEGARGEVVDSFTRVRVRGHTSPRSNGNA
jgi:hypothetical protein